MTTTPLPRSSEPDDAFLPSRACGAHAAASTRETLLRTAAVIFCEKGFHQTTVREIVQTAGASLCLVNYHFGDKLGLYREVFLSLLATEEQRYPLMVERSDLPAAEQLLEFIRMFLMRLFDDVDGARLGQLIAREMVQPTAVLDEMASDIGRPQFQRLCRIVASLLGAGLTAEAPAVRNLATGVYGHCLIYCHCRPGLERLGEPIPRDAAEIAQLAREIHRGTLGAIGALRRELAG